MVEERQPEAALAERLALVERSATGTDFDGPSWLWMVVLGILVPILLLLIGWQYV